MKIIIAGAGVIGANLARSLSAEDHEVYLIESDENTARRVDEKVDVKVICGNAADPDTLKKVRVAEADLVVAVTASDETNLVVCSLAEAFGAKRRMARVRQMSLNRTMEEFGYKNFKIDEIINPDEVAAHTIVKTVHTPGASEVADFANGQILLRAYDLPATSPLVGLKISDLSDEDFPWPFLIIAIKRNGDVGIPSSDEALKADDHIYVLLPAKSLAEFLSFIDPEIVMPNKVIVYGATHIGERVALMLSEEVRDVILLEEDEEMAEDAAERLASVKVIHGSASETDILKEAGIEAADAFIATSNSDHSNLVSAVLAKKMGAKSTTIITQQPDYTSIVDALDIDAVINPRLLAAEQILRLVRGKSIRAVIKLFDCHAEAIELVPEAGSKVTKEPLKNISLPKKSIVGAIYRDSEVILANGDTQIREGERVIVFCQESAVKKIQELFTRKKLFKS